MTNEILTQDERLLQEVNLCDSEEVRKFFLSFWKTATGKEAGERVNFSLDSEREI